jgi:hypothetical protein
VFYDDGDVEALDLATEVWRLEGQGGEARGAVKKGAWRPAAMVGLLHGCIFRLLGPVAQAPSAPINNFP